MKELLTVTANFLGVFQQDGTIRPQVELIILTSEPVYSIDPSGETAKRREIVPFRFTTDPKTLRKLGESLGKLADEADELSNQP